MTDAHEESQPTLAFWVDAESEEGDTMGLFDRDRGAVLRQVPLGPLRKNLAEAVDALQQLFADAAARGGTLPLAEAHLNFQVTASGGIQFMGSGQIQGTRGLTLVFKKPS